MNRHSRRNRGSPTHWIIGVILVVSVTSVILPKLDEWTALPRPSAPAATPLSVTLSGPTATGTVSGINLGWRLSIEKAGLLAPIVEVPFGVDENWQMDFLRTEIGHLAGTAALGEDGNIVLVGHVEMEDGSPGPFAQIRGLAQGDAILVMHSTQNALVMHRYVVTSVRDVKPDDMSVLDPHHYRELTLITCDQWNEASGTYFARVVVTAHLENSTTTNLGR